MGIENKLLKIERDVQKFVRLSDITAQAVVKLDLNETDYTVRNNAGDIVFQKLDAGRKEREEVNLKASELDLSKPDEAPHTVESKSTIEFKETNKTIDFGDTGFGDLFPQAEVERLIYDIETYTDCENIKQMIKDHTKVLEDQLKATMPEVANLAAINGLLSLPSDPLKILSWARKVVNTFFGPYTMALIDLATQIALFASALARLAGAVAAAEQNLKFCAIDSASEATTAILDEIDETLNKGFANVDDIMDKVDEAQSEISKVTGSTKRFLPSREGMTLGENITQNARSKLTEKLNEQVSKAFPAGSVDSFKSDLAAFQAVPLADDPFAAADEEVAASAMNEALGLPPRGAAVPGTVEVVIDGATFTFQNGIMVQATGTNSGTGTGISTNSVTSLPSVNSFIGAEWDGTLPTHVELITKLDGYPDASRDHPNGEIGPFGTPPMASALVRKWYIPNNLKVVSAKFSLRNDRAGFGHGSISFAPGTAGTDEWRSGVGTINTSFIYWFSATPGGSPMADVYGTPIVGGGSGSENNIRFVQGYDTSLITDDGVFDSINPIGGGQIGVARNSAGVADEPFYADSGEDAYVMLPIATKTFFFNTALVEATAGATFIANGTVPGASDLVQYIPDPAKTGDAYQAYVNNVPNQFRIVQGSIAGDVNLSLTDFLTKTFIRKDSANTIYNGTDDTMEPFIGSTWDGTYSSNTQLITDWQYVAGGTFTTVGATHFKTAPVGANTDIGFVSDFPLEQSLTVDGRHIVFAREYPIPRNGKVATSEFSVGWGEFFTDNAYDYYYDRNNSTFDLKWALPKEYFYQNVRLCYAWYDLDLMPVAWMSDTPGGSPKTLVDGSTGVVIKLEQSGATYKGQQLMSTTKSFGSDRATFPIVQKTFFLNVAVVSANTATSLVASGTAPTASQRIAWSPLDPAIGYTASGDQFLEFELGIRTNDKSDKKIPRT